MSRIADYIGNADAFPVLGRRAYFNHAGISPLPRATADRVRAFIDDFSVNGPLGERDWFAEPTRLRVLQAGLLNAGPQEIAIVKNTGEGVSAVASAIDWKPGDRVVILAEEYPANVYPWMNAARLHGVQVITLPMVDLPDGTRITLEQDIVDAIAHPDTRLLSLSHVHWGTGQAFDLRAIGQACKQHDVLFGVDAIQSHGILPIDVRAMNIDFLWAGGHKWQLGTPGAGVFFCREALIKTLHPSEVGWFSVVNPMDWGTIDFTLKDDASRFECGSPNLTAIIALNASLELLTDVTVAAAYEQVQSLNRKFRQGVQAKGYRVFTPEKFGGATVFVHPDKPPQKQFEALQKQSTELAFRLGRLRFSPHFYNTDAQVDELLGRL